MSLWNPNDENDQVFKDDGDPYWLGKPPDNGDPYRLPEFEPEPDVTLTLEDAARQALWDLQTWTKDHAEDCTCFTCGDSIPRLEEALGKLG